MQKKKSRYTFFNYLFYLLVGYVVKLLVKIIFGFKLNTDEKVLAWKKEKRSFIILCDHPSEFDATLLLSACLPNKVRFVAGAQQLYKGVQGAFLRWLKVIPKKQFVADISSVKEMILAVKSGMILGMMPEGRVSLDGTENPQDISTAKLIKKLGVPVAILKPKGTYFVKPSYNYSALIKGKLSADLYCLFEEDEIAESSPEEILEILKSHCVYNESESVKKEKINFGKPGKPCMEKVSNILYRCPSCKRLYTMKDENSKLFCTECGLLLKLLPTMQFECENKDIPDNIADWNKTQLEFEKQFWENHDAKLEFPVQKYMLTLKKEIDFRKCEEGILSLDRNGLHYSSEAETINEAISNLPGVSADYMNGFITYYSGDHIRRFFLNDVKSAARFVNSLMTLKAEKDI